MVVEGSHPESCRKVARSYDPLRWLETGDMMPAGHRTLSAWTSRLTLQSDTVPHISSSPSPLLSSPPRPGAVTACPRSR